MWKLALISDVPNREKAIALIPGKPGSAVALTAKNSAESEERNVVLVRQAPLTAQVSVKSAPPRKPLLLCTRGISGSPISVILKSRRWENVLTTSAHEKSTGL
jgi:hypothetical protein